MSRQSRPQLPPWRALATISVVVALTAGCTDGPEPDATARILPTTTSAGSSTSAPMSSPPPPTPTDRCPDRDTLDPDGMPVQDPSLDEISGAAASIREPGLVWVHEDSGNAPVITALGPDGTVSGSWTLEGVEATDWEDMAAATSPAGQPTLFVADIGDNGAVRSQISVIRVAEPDPGDTGSLTPDAVIPLVLPEPRDAEALLVDPSTGDIVIVTKALTGRSEVVVAPGGAWSPSPAPLLMEHAGTLELGLFQAVLAADVAADGAAVVLRTPGDVLWWPRPDDRSVAATLLKDEPCPLDSVLDTHGEAIAGMADGSFVLVGEGTDPELRVLRR